MATIKQPAAKSANEGGVVNSLQPVGIEKVLATIAPVDPGNQDGPFRTDGFYCTPDAKNFYTDPPIDPAKKYDFQALENQRRQCTLVNSNQYGIISFRPPRVGLKGNTLDARTQIYAVLNSAKAMVEGGLNPERIVDGSTIERIGLSETSPGVIFTDETGLPVDSIDRQEVLTVGQLAKMTILPLLGGQIGDTIEQGE